MGFACQVRCWTCASFRCAHELDCRCRIGLDIAARRSQRRVRRGDDEKAAGTGRSGPASRCARIEKSINYFSGFAGGRCAPEVCFSRPINRMVDPDQSGDQYAEAPMRSGAVACGGCGTGPIRDGARFSDACGAPITTTPESAEYKQVTVLVADRTAVFDRAAGDGNWADRYRATATACGFQGHMAMAEAMR
jgi:hypothetical protein